MIYVAVNENFAGTVDTGILETTALKVLETQSKNKEVDVSIAIEDNGTLQALNLQFLDVDAPTDVLSFPGEEIDPDTGRLYLGDIIISMPMAVVQATAAGHPTQNELQLLVIHGMLHLLGFDHATQRMKEQMWQIQARLLQDLSVKINKLPEE